MFSREIINDYGTYQSYSDSYILLRGVYDVNTLELTTINPELEQFKVFDSENINFAIQINKSIYIPSKLFSDLKTAYLESNPYYTIENLVKVQIDIKKFLDGLFSKYETPSFVATISFNSSTSGSTDTTVSNLITENKSTKLLTRYQKAGVRSVQYQFYKDNQSISLNEDAIIEHIKFLFEDTTKRINGVWHTEDYSATGSGSVDSKLPLYTDITPPISQRVSSLEDYLRDVV